jgi:hypothetical protein
VKLDTSNPRLMKLFNRVFWIGGMLPLLFFVLLAFSLGEDTKQCGEGRSNIIEYKGVEHCVSDFWAFVDALTLPWIALGLLVILTANLAPRLNKWLTDKEQ